MKIHPTAQIHPTAELDKEVEIGAHSFIDKYVKIGEATIIRNNVTITGNTTLGKGNVIFPGACVGTEPQDMKYRGGNTKLVVGDHNIFRECVTVNCGTEVGGSVTHIGNKNFFMACSHVAHDCIIEDNVVIANGVLLGGHVKVESYAKLMGLVGVQPFATIGQYSYVGGLTRIVQDVPPYMLVEGNPAKVRQVNVVGLERAGLPPKRLEALKGTFHKLFRQEALNKNKALAELAKQDGLTPEVKTLVDFLSNMAQGKFGRYRETLRDAFIR